MLSFIEENNCTGCGACYAACPVQCISMKKNCEGFFYPTASEKCIHCHKCEIVCPQNKFKDNSLLQVSKKAYIGRSLDYSVWNASASGGAFTEICKAWDSTESSLFVGAAWNGMNVSHEIGKGLSSVERFRKSKYVASDSFHCLRKVKEILESGQKVLFSGTPCQVSGLKAYLSKDYDNLFCVDIVCHGVGSPEVFRKNIEFIEEKFGKQVKAYQFRYKNKYYERDHIQRITFCDQTDILVISDSYLGLFQKQLCLRKSCLSNCPYRTRNRAGDITIGDLKNPRHFHLSTKLYNYSSIIANTEKGLQLIDKLKHNIYIVPCSIDDIERYNPLFSKKIDYNQDRDVFFKEFLSDPLPALSKWGGNVVQYKRTKKRIILEKLPRKIIERVLKDEN